MAVQVRSPAPQFKAQAYLRTTEETRELALDDFKGRWLCLFFYPNDFSDLCPTELAAFQAALAQFRQRGCEVLGCSCDSAYVHRAFCDSREELKTLAYPLLADTTKRLALDYGVLLPERGVALRGTFLIDPDGVVRWHAQYDLPVGRGTAELLRVLDALQTEQPCPCNWEKGQATLKR